MIIQAIQPVGGGAIPGDTKDRTKYLKYFIIAFLFQLLLISLVFLFSVKNGTYPNRLTSVLSAWDAHHYQYLAKFGYSVSGDEANYIVFFPLYPVIVRLVNYIVPSVVFSSLLVTWIFSICTHFLYLVFLDSIKLDLKTKLLATILFFSSPINAYFFSAYSEALYLFLVLLFFILMERKLYLLASVAGMLVALTRNVGVLLILPFLIQVFSDSRYRINRHVLKAGIISAGLLVYLIINLVLFKDPFHFKGVMSEHWYKGVVSPIVSYRYLLDDFPKHLVVESSVTRTVDHVMLFLLPFLLTVYELVNHKHRYLPVGLSVWVIANWLVIASQSFFLSSARYIFTLFPLYLMFATITLKSKFWLFFAFPLLCVFAYLSIIGVDIYSKGEWLY